jgi:RNA polymerase sigma-70 factor (ECF subfamily)
MTAAQESFYIQQFKLGDNNSFQILYQHYHKRIINYGKALFPNNEDDVKDAYQDVFIALWKARERLSVEITLDFYLKRCIRNHLIQVKQKELKYHRVHDEEGDLNLKLVDETNSLTSLIESESVSIKEQIFLKKLSLLTKRQRFLFTERFIHEKSIEEIMEEHNLARQTVYNTIYRCISVLKTGIKTSRMLKG